MANKTKSGVKQQMETLGIYKPEFDATIDRYVALSKEYNLLYKRYKDDGFQCTVKGAQGEKKSPLVATLESLRRDILLLEESLGLTPRGILKLRENAFKMPKNGAKKDRLV